MIRKLDIAWAFAVLLSISNCSKDTPVTDCDKLAASPTDPQHKVVGVLPDEIKADLTISACVSAVHQYPNEARLEFQPGRAYFKAQKLDSAADQFRKAAEQGYAAAQYNLGLMYEYGQGVPQDYREALVGYRKTADQGDEKAKGKPDQLS